MNLNGSLIFSGYDETNDSERLFKTDGTADGTVLISNYGGFSFTVVDDIAFYVADDGVGQELWKTDGTVAGTMIVKDFNNSYLRRYPIDLTVVDSTLFFIIEDGVQGNEQLWKSDGTEAGTTLLAVIGSYNPFYPTKVDLNDVNGTLYLFEQFATSTKARLWKSDGTEAGTILVKEFAPTYGDIATLSGFEGKLYFSIFTFVTDSYDSYYRELWKSDGTENGTVLIEQFAYGDYNAEMLNINDNLIFTAPDPENGSLFYYLSHSLTPGDFNGDGHVNAADISPAMQALSNPSDYETQYNVLPADLLSISDVNEDGQFTTADLQTLLNRLNYSQAPVAAGDFNRDGHVNAADIGPAMQALSDPAGYGAQYVVSPSNLSIIGDVNGDGQFTNADLQRLLYLLRTGDGSLSSEQNTPANSNNNSNATSQPAEVQTLIVTETPIATISNDAKPIE